MRTRLSIPDIVCFIYGLAKVLGLASTPAVPETWGMHTPGKKKIEEGFSCDPLDEPRNMINWVFWTYTTGPAGCLKSDTI